MGWSDKAYAHKEVTKVIEGAKSKWTDEQYQFVKDASVYAYGKAGNGNDYVGGLYDMTNNIGLSNQDKWNVYLKAAFDSTKSDGAYKSWSDDLEWLIKETAKDVSDTKDELTSNSTFVKIGIGLGVVYAIKRMLG